jgi:hypothetical protein
LSGFLSTILLIAWAGIFPYGILIVAVYGLVPSLTWFGGNLGAAYVLNQARKHGRKDAFDDRLTQERMDQAISWWIEEVGARESGE